MLVAAESEPSIGPSVIDASLVNAPLTLSALPPEFGSTSMRMLPDVPTFSEPVFTAAALFRKSSPLMVFSPARAEFAPPPASLTKASLPVRDNSEFLSIVVIDPLAN
jgi:hypothetical protein